MTAPEARAGGIDANTRGIAVLVVAVLIGVVLLLQAGKSNGTTNVATAGSDTTVDTSGLATTTTTTAPAGDTTTSTQPALSTRPVSEVQVLVLNGSGKVGVAAAGTNTLRSAGYATLEPTNANQGIRPATTTVYFAAGYQADATGVARVLGRGPEAVTALPNPAPGPGTEAANVVVLLGADTTAVDTAASSASTTTTVG